MELGTDYLRMHELLYEQKLEKNRKKATKINKTRAEILINLSLIYFMKEVKLNVIMMKLNLEIAPNYLGGIA